jgi:MFS superfamily molybdate transporter
MRPFVSRLNIAMRPLIRGNRFDRLEWAGAFGDLGTLIPFVVAYLAVLKLDPLGVLLSFGIAMVVAGVMCRTPFPVQPMKAAGAVATTQAAQTLTITGCWPRGRFNRSQASQLRTGGHRLE